MIYLDSCIVIYAFEDLSPRGDRVRLRLSEAGETTVAISPLVKLECLVGPLKEQDFGLRDRYLAGFAQFRLLDTDDSAFIRAAELRAAHGLRTPDALHLAAAQVNGCTELWTNDDRLAKADRGLSVDVTGAPAAG